MEALQNSRGVILGLHFLHADDCLKIYFKKIMVSEINFSSFLPVTHSVIRF